MQTTGKIENRGGRREGSGRKRYSISDGEVKKLLRAFKQEEKLTGVSVWDKLAEIAYRKDKRAVTIKEQTTAIKLYAECTITRAVQSESHVEKSTGPAVYLPTAKPDPAGIALVKKAGNG